jgi:DNA-binding response OmpR family regulator
MSAQCRSDLKSTAPTSVSPNAMNPLLAGVHRDLREPLTAMLRLNNDWNVRRTDMVSVRIIERQRQALEVMADLIDSFLTIAEPEMQQPPAPLRPLDSRPADGKLREASATPEPRTEEWSAEWSMKSAVDCPKVPVAVGPASRVRRVLLVSEDRGVLSALRVYLLCAGYRVLAAANVDEALDRAWMARMSTSLIDIIIVNSEFAGDDNGLAVIDKTRRLLGYNVPAVLLTTQTSILIGKAALLTAVYLLRNPVNLDELSTLIGEVLRGPTRSCPDHLAPLHVSEETRMTITHPELLDSRQFQGLVLPAHPTSGTEDDDDDRDDEHAGENEAPGRAIDEGTEAPEEFEVDDKGNLNYLDDDAADEEDRSFAAMSPP